jgi:hypothetical protein
MGGIYPLSDIRANTISDASGNGPINLHKQSAAKAWVYGSTTAADLGGFNLSSGTDHGIGDFTYPLIVHMADLYYSQSVSTVTGTSDRVTSRNLSRHGVAVVAVLTSNARTNTNTDHNHNATIHGDLA